LLLTFGRRTFQVLVVFASIVVYKLPRMDTTSLISSPREARATAADVT
jgi:hypothetical protein